MGRILDLSELQLELGLEDAITESERAVLDDSIRRAEAAVINALFYDPVRTTSRIEYYPQSDRRDIHRINVFEVSGSSAILRNISEASTDEIQIQHLPGRSFEISVDYDGRFGTQAGSFSENLTQGTDYWPQFDGHDDDGEKICRDGIVRSLGRWPVNPGSIRITYTSGYSADEFHGKSNLVNAMPILDAVLVESVRRARRRFIQQKTVRGFLAGPIVSENLGDYSYSVGGASVSSRSDSSSYGSNAIGLEAREMLEPFLNHGYELAS